MKKIINFYDFERAFIHMGRENQFSYKGKKALFEYLEQYEEETSEQLELDVIALCCEFSEFENLEEFQNAFSNEYKNLEDIENETTVIYIESSESFIIQNF